jgi:hypothetical protein
MTDKNASIVASGVKKDIGCRVVLWDEDGGFSFYKSGKLYRRDLSLSDLRKQISCFVVHHSVTYRASHMYNGLNARGLSVNFIIDDDINDDGCATIYQCADIKDACWSHGPLNRAGPGVEISYMPQAWQDPNLYSERIQQKYDVLPHKLVEDMIRGHKFSKVFAPTDAQVKACARLLWGFSELFPDVKAEFPKRSNGEYIKAKIDNPNGFLNHYNITNRKVDAMGLDLEWLESEIERLRKLKDKEPIKIKFRLISRIFKRLMSRRIR